MNSQFRPQRRVSMADVAKHAGVSAQTVSRVANGTGTVIPDTRRRVIDAMDALGYRPNSAARALKLGSFRTIGVLSQSLSTLGDVRTIEAIATSAAIAGYATTLVPVHVAAHSQADVDRLFSRMQELAVDALILNLESPMLAHAAEMLPPGVPVVYMDPEAPDARVVVDTDQNRGGADAVRHLLDLGHRTVWHIAGPERSRPSGRREDGWRTTLEAAGRDVPPVLRGDWSVESGYLAGKRIAARDDVTAVFCSNDQMALGFYRAVAEADKRVPQDISVVGFDDTADARGYAPPLTSMHQDFAEVGQRCVSSALALVGGRDVPALSVVVPQLVVRDSTAPPAL
ncbi:LacI family DNA-binding transcriptional regulator [Microbacterium amylolyticum]|uniref:DNA-binding LacI/PurR family transcriptional regulator n=1 Tax=Microbacterium amylolyticum TaxID=936337 RepID=A0ABS4ZHQ5_9MICO|nr:LacI family DNA-binding transcriptional regulator [Microbacterium amylolyticum]MBP2436814.1 DNA-binding LacI/PurR family transcriptional regulator [Microbacterium amylolyticum]